MSNITDLRNKGRLQRRKRTSNDADVSELRNQVRRLQRLKRDSNGSGRPRDVVDRNTSGLTEKQAKFVVEYLLTGGNQTRAAINAGYAASSAHVRGSQLVKNEYVAAAIQALRNQMMDNAEATIEDLVTRLFEIALTEHDEVKASDSIAASKLLFDYEFRMAPASNQHELIVRYEDERRQLHSGDVVDVSALPADVEVISDDEYD